MSQVLLVDDHALVRSDLAAFLMAFDDLELVAEASSGEVAVSPLTQALAQTFRVFPESTPPGHPARCQTMRLGGASEPLAW